MDTLLLFASIARSIGTLLTLGLIEGKHLEEYGGLLGLVSTIAMAGAAGNASLKELDDQLKEGLRNGRGLTENQRAIWRSRSDMASAEIQAAASGNPLNEGLAYREPIDNGDRHAESVAFQDAADSGLTDETDPNRELGDVEPPPAEGSLAHDEPPG